MEPARNLEPLEDRLKSIRDLPTLPVVVSTVMKLLNDSDAPLREVGEIVATDPVLSARTLRMVNAPYFGLRRRLTSVVDAAIYLGRSGMRNLVVSSGLVHSIKGREGRTPGIEFWEHGFATAIYARMFAAHACSEHADDAYLAGLVHDIGRLVLDCHFSEEADQVQKIVLQTGQSAVEAEQGYWQATHADVGAWLGEMWHLPENVVDASRTHHCPEQASLERVDLAAVVHLADEYAFEVGFHDSKVFDAPHRGLEHGCQVLSRNGRMLVSPDSMREMAGSDAAEVRMLVEMIYEV